MEGIKETKALARQATVTRNAVYMKQKHNPVPKGNHTSE
jgi:hypothetical protein